MSFSGSRAISSLTVDVIDEVIEQIEALLLRAVERRQQRSKVKRQTILMDTVPLFGVARDIMMLALSDPDDVERAQLTTIFGGDCIRICRMHAVLEMVMTSFPDESITAKDLRVPQCLDACEAVESVLQSLGLGWQMKEGLRQQRTRLGQRTSGEEGIQVEDASRLKVEQLEQTLVLHDEDNRIIAPGANEDAAPTLSPSKPDNILDPLRSGPRLSWKVPSSMDPLKGPRNRPESDDAMEASGTRRGYSTNKSTDAFVSEHFAALTQDFFSPDEYEDDASPRRIERKRRSTWHASEPSSILSVEIISSWRSEDAVMWYSIQVQDNDVVKFLHKRYSDFKALHRSLQVFKWAGVVLPALPPPGLIGLRKTRQFNQKRQFGLQSYLDDVLAKFRPLSRAPTLGAFLGQTPGFVTCVYNVSETTFEQ